MQADQGPARKGRKDNSLLGGSRGGGGTNNALSLSQYIFAKPRRSQCLDKAIRKKNCGDREKKGGNRRGRKTMD